MRNQMDSFIEQVGKLQTGKKETTTVVVGYNESDDTLDCVEVPRDTESVERIAHVLDTLGTVTGRMKESMRCDDLVGHNNAGNHLEDELSYSNLKPYQMDVIKLLAGLKAPTMVLGNARHPSIIEIDSYPKPVKDFAIVKPRQELIKADFAALELKLLNSLTIESLHRGAWREPTHAKQVDGKVYHYYMLEPTMLSVQIALLCGFELKQRIERITHVNGKRKG